MKVDATAVVTNTRNSVRITTNSQYNGGLFIMDSVHMPTGCGIWPYVITQLPIDAFHSSVGRTEHSGRMVYIKG